MFQLSLPTMFCWSPTVKWLGLKCSTIELYTFRNPTDDQLLSQDLFLNYHVLKKNEVLSDNRDLGFQSVS